jgi:lysozyme
VNQAAVIAALLARPFEGLYLRPYIDPVGIPTVGYGATFYEDGVRVTLKDPPITRERAEELLQWEMCKCVREAYRLCPVLYLWGEQAVAAIADFAFNCGTGALAASTLRRRIAADMHAEAKAELMKWVRGGGRVLPGLVKRRAAECALIG